MPDVVSWDSVPGNNEKRSKDGIRNLRLSSGNGGSPQTFEVRFVGHPIKFYKFFENGKSAIVKDKENNPITKKYGKEPGVRYAANVLNRADGQVYLTEFPQSVYNDIRDWGQARKTDPGGKNGCNFSITVKGMKKDTRYKTVGLDITPFTEEEKEYLRQNIYDLTKLFKETPEDVIEEKLGYSAAAAAAAAAHPSNPAPPTAAPVQADATGGVDLPF